MGMLIKDVLRALPNEVGELLYVVEFINYNTPGAHGYIPRDIDRRWNLSTPLERELQPFQVNEFEPLDDYIRNLFPRLPRVTNYYFNPSAVEGP